jgi:serpin B
MYRLALFISLSALTIACAGEDSPVPSQQPQQRHSSLSRDVAPAIAPADLTRLVADNTDFGLALHRAIAQPGVNSATSPFSVSEALAMTFAGAEGQTSTQIAQALRFSLPPAQLHPAFDALDLAITSREHAASPGQAPLKLRIANSLWGQRDFPILAPFLDTLAVDYGAGMSLVDFSRDFESASTRPPPTSAPWST